MAQRHVTARGKPIDMGRLRDLNSHKPALGNASSNARGDIIDKKGTVLKTQEQIVAEWAASKKQRDSNTRPVNIKSNTLIPDLGGKTVPVALKHLDVNDQDFDPVTEPELSTAEPVRSTHSRKKITESDK
jgi:hypothetical protein